MSLNSDLFFRCRRTIPVDKRVNNNNIKCTFKRHIFFGTILNNKNDVLSFIRFLAYKLIIDPNQEFLSNELDLSGPTIVNFNKFLRLVCKVSYDRNFKRIGGVGHTVEVDETRFGPGEKAINAEKGFWVMGGIDRNTHDIFAIITDDRSADTLLKNIKKFIKPNTMIYTDGWSSYGCLTRNGYGHELVNHKYNHVDPDTGVHTNNVERLWGILKKHIPMEGGLKKYFDLYFAEFRFRRQHNFNHIFEDFLQASKGITNEDLKHHLESLNEDITD